MIVYACFANWKTPPAAFPFPVYNTHTQMRFKHELTRSLFPYPNVRLLVSFYFSPQQASNSTTGGCIHTDATAVLCLVKPAARFVL